MSRARTMRSAEEGETTIKRRTEPRGRLPRHRDQGPARVRPCGYAPFFREEKKRSLPIVKTQTHGPRPSWPGPHAAPSDLTPARLITSTSTAVSSLPLLPAAAQPPPRLPPVARCFLCAKLPSYLYHHAPCSAKRPDTDLRLPYHPTTRVLPDRINATAALPCPPTQRSPDPTAPLFILHRPATFLVQLI